MSSNVAKPYTPDFTDAEHKLNRAKSHIADVDFRIAGFLSADLYRLRFEPDEGKTHLKVILDSRHQIDPSINTVIGDAVGNLRSVLDYMAVALVSPIMNNTKRTKFPIAKDKSSFRGEVNGQNGFGPCDQRIRDYFIDHVQAYKDGAGHDIWVLNALRNTDKHRLLIVTTHLAGLKASWNDKRGNVHTNVTFGSSAGQNSSMIIPIDSQFTDDPRPAFHVEFNEAGVIE